MTAREQVVADRIEQAIALEFEGQGEAWSDRLSGDRLARYARRAVEPITDALVAEVAALTAQLQAAQATIAEIQSHHHEKHGESPRYAEGDLQHELEPVGWEHYVICDYDKTSWPCMTQRILSRADTSARTRRQPDEHLLMSNILRVLGGNRALADQVIAEVEDSLWLATHDDAAARQQVTLDKVRQYAKDREAYGKRGRTVHSARIASDLFNILGES